MLSSAGNSFSSRSAISLAGEKAWIYRLDAVDGAEALPFAHKVILENLLRHEDGISVTADMITGLVATGSASSADGIAFYPSRIFLHDTNGVPVLTDLAALRAAVAENGGDPARVSPVIPAELTVDHSVSTDFWGGRDALARNIDTEYQRNSERYRFLKWGSHLDGLAVIPPGSGIMHQINLEYLARVVERRDGLAYPDTCAGTDSHTTMVNGLGVLAWGIGGIEAEAALLGCPLTMRIPPVVGVRLTGRLRPGVTATDLVLTIAERMREHGVVGKIIEFTGPALPHLSIATRATIANMSPEFGSTSAMFPIDAVTLDYLRFTGRTPDHVAATEAYAKAQGLWHDPGAPIRFDEVTDFDLAHVEPSIAGPRRPQDRIPLSEVQARFRRRVEEPADDRAPRNRAGTLPDGAIAIAAITSCTNTSNPQVMIAAGLVARNARERGLQRKPWVKTSLAPGSKTVTDYLARAGLDQPLDELGFRTVGYGCMTCIGNSGPLLPGVEQQVRDDGLQAAAVLSGNRNFDARINNDVALNYLASPPLVVAYALTGTIDHDLTTEPIGTARDGAEVYLSDLWPSDAEVDQLVASSLKPEMFTAAYRTITDGDERWGQLPAPRQDLYPWDPESTYLRRPPFLDAVTAEAAEIRDIGSARALLMLGDSVTTDHISPAGRIPLESVAGRYLTQLGVAAADLNTYASRRGNFEVMVRGGFSNRRLENRLAPGRGGETRDPADPEAILPVYEAAQSARESRIPLIVVAGNEYGTGSSRDWAAKATALLGVRAVIARSFERIHRGNLVQLGVLPLQFQRGQSADSLGLTGREEFSIRGIQAAIVGPQKDVEVTAVDGSRTVRFAARLRIDTALEATYYRHGGILPYVYRTRFPADAR